jgi:multiple sugar transport system substrate-binding protein
MEKEREAIVSQGNVITFGRSAATRRRVLRAGAVATGSAAAALLAACGGGAPQPAAGQAGGELSQAPATVTFLGRSNVTNQQSFDELTKRFMQDHPAIKVEYTHEPGNFDQKYQVLAAGGQTPDVGFSTVANFKVHVANGISASFDDLAKRDKTFKIEDYDAYWLEALKYRGKLSGLPWDPGMVVLMFNRNVLQKAGVTFPDTTNPMTWEDTVELAKRLTKENGGQYDVVGLEVWWARFWWQIPRQMGLMDVYQGDENVLKLDNPIAIDAIQWMADLRTKLKVSRAPGVSGPATSFSAGNVALNAGGAWDAANQRRDLQDDWDWAPLPQFKGKKRVAMGQASPFILAASSKVKDQAWQLMRLMSGPIGQELAMTKGTSQPMLKSQHNSPAYTKQQPPHASQVPIEETKYGVPPPYGPSYQEVQALVDKVLAPVYTGEQSARQAITAAAPEFKRLMDEAKARWG